jgi:hypothetical protein
VPEHHHHPVTSVLHDDPAGVVDDFGLAGEKVAAKRIRDIVSHPHDALGGTNEITKQHDDCRSSARVADSPVRHENDATPTCRTQPTFTRT